MSKTFPSCARGLAWRCRWRPARCAWRWICFSLSANNITYAAFGDAGSYWRFFPSGEDGWGIVPVWGFATVTESTHDGMAVGERLYGFWPMASHAVITPGRVSPLRMVDAAPHRAELPAAYNA